MRFVVVLLIGLVGVPAAKALQIVPQHARLAPGGTIGLRGEPPAFQAKESGFVEFWWLQGPGVVDRWGRYRAPYIISAPGVTTRVLLLRGFHRDLDTAEVTIDLDPGEMLGTSDCLAPGQHWSLDGRSLDSQPLDELPEVLTRVRPEYPRSVEARRLSGTVLVAALVCRSGRVIDAWTNWPESVDPIPELETLAIDAVRQWVFKPASTAGQPVACVVLIPVRFPPN